MGILGQDVNVCHLNKRFVENFFMNKNVFFQKSRSGKLGSHKESENGAWERMPVKQIFGLIFVIHFSRQEKIMLK